VPLAVGLADAQVAPSLGYAVAGVIADKDETALAVWAFNSEGPAPSIVAVARLLQVSRLSLVRAAAAALESRESISSQKIRSIL
jgi:hypothetical protein